MTNSIHFPKAPITEALLDIRVSLPSDTSLEMLELFQQEIKNQYPLTRKRVSGTFSFGFKDQAAPVVEQSAHTDGFFFTSADQQRIVQARLDGFTFSWLKPYDRWETFRDEAKRLWEHYQKIASPLSITRVALRYINRIDLPFKDGRSVDFNEYLLTRPEISPELPQDLADFFVRLVIMEKKLPAFAVVTQTLQQADKQSGVLPLILDIDVFREATFPCATEEVWCFFEKLRQLKNDVFLRSLTDKTKELFR